MCVSSIKCFHFPPPNWTIFVEMENNPSKTNTKEPILKLVFVLWKLGPPILRHTELSFTQMK